MYNQYRNSGIRGLRNYEEALAFYNRVDPIRGKGINAGIRPLGHRNRPWFNIRQNDNGDLTCVLHQIDVITFCQDDTIWIRHGGWISQTTANFIDDVLHSAGFSARIYDRSVIVSYMGKHYRLTKNGFSSRNGDITNPPKECTYKINRKKMNAIRRDTQAFRTYLIGTTKLRNGYFENDEIPDQCTELEHKAWRISMDKWGTTSKEKLAEFVNTVKQKEDDGNWHKASLQVVFLSYHWQNSIRTCVDDIIHKLDMVLMAANPEVFDVVELPQGTVKRNRYGNYTKYVEE